jgi:ABC-type nitrate/sulfonate/bicarbonate transport system substrate-binding protein
MKKIFLALLVLFLLNTSTEAADKIRIGVPVLAAQFITLPLAEKRGFLREEGVEAEIIRIFGPAVSAALVSRELDYHMGPFNPTRDRRFAN